MFRALCSVTWYFVCTNNCKPQLQCSPVAISYSIHPLHILATPKPTPLLHNTPSMLSEHTLMSVTAPVCFQLSSVSRLLLTYCP